MPVINKDDLPGSHDQCSLEGRIPEDGPIWTLAAVTQPEGSDHPYIIGRTGDCHGCLKDLVEVADRLPIPAEIISTADTGCDFCECPKCDLMSKMIWSDLGLQPIMADFDSTDPHPTD